MFLHHPVDTGNYFASEEYIVRSVERKSNICKHDEQQQFAFGYFHFAVRFPLWTPRNTSSSCLHPEDPERPRRACSRFWAYGIYIITCPLVKKKKCIL